MKKNNNIATKHQLTSADTPYLIMLYNSWILRHNPSISGKKMRYRQVSKLSNFPWNIEKRTILCYNLYK